MEGPFLLDFCLAPKAGLGMDLGCLPPLSPSYYMHSVTPAIVRSDDFWRQVGGGVRTESPEERQMVVGRDMGEK